jgi:hypothetical protein
MPDRRQTCRLLVTNKRGSLDRCTAEVAEEGAEIDLCPHHLSAALALLNRRLATTP